MLEAVTLRLVRVACPGFIVGKAAQIVQRVYVHLAWWHMLIEQCENECYTVWGRHTNLAGERYAKSRSSLGCAPNLPRNAPDQYSGVSCITR